jgi:chromosomal replication initiator protein
MIIGKMNYWIIPAITNLGSRYNEDALKGAIKEILCITPQMLESKCRKRHLVEARQIYCYLLREHTNMSTKHIGQTLGGRDHSTVIHSVRALQTTLEVEKLQGLRHMHDALEAVQNYLIIL